VKDVYKPIVYQLGLMTHTRLHCRRFRCSRCETFKNCYARND